MRRIICVLLAFHLSNSPTIFNQNCSYRLIFFSQRPISELLRYFLETKPFQRCWQYLFLHRLSSPVQSPLNRSSHNFCINFHDNISPSEAEGFINKGLYVVTSLYVSRTGLLSNNSSDWFTFK